MESLNLTAAAYALLFTRSDFLPPEQILAGTGFDEAQLQGMDYVSWDKMAIMLRNIDAAGVEPGWAARTGMRLGASSHGPLGFAALSAPTLGAALQVMADYHAVRNTMISARLESVGRRYRFSMQDLTGDDQYAFWIMQTTLKVMETLIVTIVGHPAGDNVEITFAYPTPHYAATLDSIYGTPCLFNAPHTAISVPRSWQHIPSPLYDEGTYRSNIAKCRQIISHQSGDRDPVMQVRNLLANHFDEVLAGNPDAGHPPGLEQIAEQLHVTPRTLIRRLKRSNTAYRTLLEDARFQCAATLLQQAHNTVADVGYRLGYRDPANFGRAFRNWTGTTPAAWRRGQGQSQGQAGRQSP